MSRTIVYTGDANTKIITAADWLSIGVTAETRTWDKGNNYQQVVTDLEAIYLLAQSYFTDELGLQFPAVKDILTKVDYQIVGRFGALGDSITAGVSEAGAGTAAPFGDNAPNSCSWPFMLVARYPDLFNRVTNAGVGGDVPGGLGHLTVKPNPGATSLTLRLQYGTNPFGSQGIYLGGYGPVTSETKTYSGIIINGDGTITLTGLAAVVGANWEVGTEVGWGMHGRLKAQILDKAPDSCGIMAGTNALNTDPPAAIAVSVSQLGMRCRAAGIEPWFMEILPRSNFQDLVVQTNTFLEYECRKVANRFHLLKTHRLFAKSDGTFAVGADTTDGLHLSRAGVIKLVDFIKAYMVDAGLKPRKTVIASKSSDPMNAFTGADPLFTTAQSAGMTLVTTTVATGGSANTIVFGTGTWPVDRWKGMQVRTTSGTGSGQTRRILSNTATTITTESNWGVNPAAGTNFVIEGLYPNDWTFTTFFGANIGPFVRPDSGAEGLVLNGNWFGFKAGVGTPAGNNALSKTFNVTIGDILAVSMRVKTVGLTGGAYVSTGVIDNVFNNRCLNQYLGPDDDMIVQSVAAAGATSCGIQFQYVPTGTGAGECLWFAPRVLNMTTNQFLV